MAPALAAAPDHQRLLKPNHLLRPPPAGTPYVRPGPGTEGPPLPFPQPAELIFQMGLPPRAVAMAAVNGSRVEFDHLLANGDQVVLLPQAGGG
ncbi:MAG: MoaD/ThiS family protein [Mycobacterium leprae]